MHRKILIAAAAILLLSPPAQGRDQPQAEGEEREQARILDRITVVAHRQPRQVSEVAGTVTVIGQERLADDMVFDAADLVRYEPGIDIDGGGSRFGFSGFRVRGIGGNRTAVVVDNVPVSDQFDTGAFADTGRALLDLGLTQRVEILRGPASTLYGSKALGGVVAISTIGVDDIITDGDHGTRVGLRGATDSDRARLGAATAFRKGAFDLLIAGAAQRSDEIDVAGRPDDTPRDLLDRDQQRVLIKGGYDAAFGAMHLTLDGSRETRETDLRAALGHSSQFANTKRLLGDDRRNSWRLLLDQDLNAIGPINRGHWRLWHQDSATRQETDDHRPAAPVPVDVFRRFEFDQTTSGIGADLESDLQTGGLNHRIGYGFEYTRSQVSTRRNGLETRLEDGQTSNVILGEVFPLRDFPRSRISELGVYLHDEVRLWQGGPILSPGIRWEHYDLSLLSDPLFDQSFPNAQTTELSLNRWLPRLGLIWPINDSLEFFAQYARGLRAPPFGDVNIGLEWPRFRVRAIANPDLKPERGRTFEAGLRWRGADTRAEVALYRNDYRDFIQSRAPLGFDPESGFNIFQSINRDRVRIEGGELRLRRQLGAGFSAELAGEWSRGKDRISGRALPGVTPPTAIAELGWHSPGAGFQTRLIATAVRGQRKLVDAEGDLLFSAPGHLTVDWLGRWFPRHDLEVGFGLFNLGDRKYWQNGRVIGYTPDDPTLPLLAEPGRWAMLSLTWHR